MSALSDLDTQIYLYHAGLLAEFERELLEETLSKLGYDIEELL